MKKNICLHILQNTMLWILYQLQNLSRLRICSKSTGKRKAYVV